MCCETISFYFTIFKGKNCSQCTIILEDMNCMLTLINFCWYPTYVNFSCLLHFLSAAKFHIPLGIQLTLYKTLKPDASLLYCLHLSSTYISSQTHWWPLLYYFCFLYMKLLIFHLIQNVYPYKSLLTHFSTYTLLYWQFSLLKCVI